MWNKLTSQPWEHDVKERNEGWDQQFGFGAEGGLKETNKEETTSMIAQFQRTFIPRLGISFSVLISSDASSILYYPIICVGIISAYVHHLMKNFPIPSTQNNWCWCIFIVNFQEPLLRITQHNYTWEISSKVSKNEEKRNNFSKDKFSSLIHSSWATITDGWKETKKKQRGEGRKLHF